jgi:hypothetical protein
VTRQDLRRCGNSNCGWIGDTPLRAPHPFDLLLRESLQGVQQGRHPMTLILSDSDPIARRDHRCIWCGETIVKGEKYHKQSGRFDGDFYVNKLHAECQSAMSELCNIDRYAVLRDWINRVLKD